MTVVDCKEFITNEDKYFDLALNGGVCIQRGEYLFHLGSRPFEKQYQPKPATRLSDMFRGALSKESAESLNQHVKTMREEWGESDFSLSAGIWKDYDIDASNLRKQAWKIP